MSPQSVDTWLDVDCGCICRLFQRFRSKFVQIENAKAGTTQLATRTCGRVPRIEGYASRTTSTVARTISLFVNVEVRQPERTDLHDGHLSACAAGRGGLGGARFSGRSPDGNIQDTPAPDADGMVRSTALRPVHAGQSKQSERSDGLGERGSSSPSSLGLRGAQSYIVFTVGDDNRVPASDYLFQWSVNTLAGVRRLGQQVALAFNGYQNLPARKVSFSPPYDRERRHGRFHGRHSSGWELNMIRFLEREGYDVSYMTSVDACREGVALLAPHKAFLSSPRRILVVPDGGRCPPGARRGRASRLLRLECDLLADPLRAEQGREPGCSEPDDHCLPREPRQTADPYDSIPAPRMTDS